MIIYFFMPVANTVKSAKASKKLLSTIVKNSSNNKYVITFDNNNIVIKENDKILCHQELELLNYDKDHNIISDILSSLIYKFNNCYLGNIYKDKTQIENTILYVFLLPIVNKKNEFIIKVGYAKDLLVRKEQLKKEFNIDEIYLIYCCQIKNEAIELELHKRLKKYNNVKSYYINKYSKKNEKEIICEETYIFSYSILNTIIQEIYKMELNYEANILDKKITLANIEKDKAISVATIEKEKAIIEKEKSIEIAIIEKEKEEIIMNTKKYDIEYIKLQIELAKINNNKF